MKRAEILSAAANGVALAAIALLIGEGAIIRFISPQHLEDGVVLVVAVIGMVVNLCVMERSLSEVI